VIPPALALTDITKRFGALVALDRASLSANWGTVHALLGENGAGKTTLMRVAFGMIRPDTGTVTVAGIAQRFGSPTDAIRAGIGMVHQHFALVGAMTVAENVALGSRGLYDASAAAARVRRLSADTGLSLDPGARVDALSIEEQQRVEVMKALARDARILVLDEPTAVLSPPRASELLQWLRRFADGGRAVVLITHNLREALSVADDVTVLRHGRTVLEAAASTVDADRLAAAMIGELREGLPNPLTPSPEGEGGSPLLKLRLDDEGLRPSTPPPRMLFEGGVGRSPTKRKRNSPSPLAGRGLGEGPLLGYFVGETTSRTNVPGSGLGLPPSGGGGPKSAVTV